MFGLIRKKTLLKNIIVVRDRAEKDANKAGSESDAAYYLGVVDACYEISFNYETWGS